MVHERIQGSRPQQNGGHERINARAESIVATASFREAIKKRRCLVPAGAFYKWQKIGAKTKQAFAIGMLDGSQYGFADLWESRKEEDGTLLETFTIITTDPNEFVKPFTTGCG
jgi:putative SOS response-associated peptidase YedK